MWLSARLSGGQRGGVEVVAQARWGRPVWPPLGSPHQSGGWGVGGKRGP